MSFSRLTAWRCRLLTQINYNRLSGKVDGTWAEVRSGNGTTTKMPLAPTARFVLSKIRSKIWEQGLESS